MSTEVLRNPFHELNFETVGVQQLEVSSERLDWIDHDSVINTAVVTSPHGEFIFGNVIGLSSHMRKIATDEMLGREVEELRLNKTMYRNIYGMLSDPHFAIKRVNTDACIPIYFDGQNSGPRIFFAEYGTDIVGRRIFLKIAVCGSKSKEPNIFAKLKGTKISRAENRLRG